MNVSQALEYERQPFIPMFIYGDHGAMESERQKGEEALKALETEYFTAEDDPGFDFATVRDLADRNRDLCDQIGEARLRNVTPATLSRGLSDADTCAAIGKMQKRTAASVMREIRGDRDALGVAYARKPIQGTVLGIDIETTGRAPERGYIINVGWEIMELTSDAVPHDAEAHYCGLPDIYRGEDVPLSNIHHITWDDIDGKTPFRENKELQKQLLKLMKKYPYMAHNAAFEDSWFKIHLDGYAEARRAGKIIVIDSRQICRSLDADVRSLPRESAPAALENWARRRGTLAADANEQHLASTTPTHAPYRAGRVQPQEPICQVDCQAEAPFASNTCRAIAPVQKRHAEAPLSSDAMRADIQVDIGPFLHVAKVPTLHRRPYPRSSMPLAATRTIR